MFWICDLVWEMKFFVFKNFIIVSCFEFVTSALFSSEKISDFATVALSFLFDKYCPIMNKLGSKDSSRDLQTNCVISFYFRLYLMLHACATRFDVMGNLKNFLDFGVK